MVFSWSITTLVSITKHTLKLIHLQQIHLFPINTDVNLWPYVHDSFISAFSVATCLINSNIHTKYRSRKSSLVKDLWRRIWCNSYHEKNVIKIILSYISLRKNEEIKHILHCDIAFMIIKLHIYKYITNTIMKHPDWIINHVFITAIRMRFYSP